MLSRIAEALFWIGRYVERADDTARILDIHTQTLLDDPWAESSLTCRALLSIMDHPLPVTDQPIDTDLVIRALAQDTTNASSIVGALIAARENARRARESISSELWETLNTTRNEAAIRSTTMLPHDFFVWVRERTAIVAGIIDSATSRDATWNFIVLGRSIERADMTARLLTSQVRLGEAGPGWMTLLRSCGAYEAFLRAQRGNTDDIDAAGFLLRDWLFPRSIVAALRTGEARLVDLEPMEGQRGVDDDARRELGIVRTELEYSRLEDIMSDLPHLMAKVQIACSEASKAIAERYFPTQAKTSWIGEAL